MTTIASQYGIPHNIVHNAVFECVLLEAVEPQLLRAAPKVDPQLPVVLLHLNRQRRGAYLPSGILELQQTHEHPKILRNPEPPTTLLPGPELPRCVLPHQQLLLAVDFLDRRPTNLVDPPHRLLRRYGCCDQPEQCHD